MDKIRNTDVLISVMKDPKILFNIKKSKLEYLDHILRNETYELLKLILEGNIEGKIGLGRRRISCLKNPRQLFKVGKMSRFRTAVGENMAFKEEE